MVIEEKVVKAFMQDKEITVCWAVFKESTGHVSSYNQHGFYVKCNETNTEDFLYGDVTDIVFVIDDGFQSSMAREKLQHIKNIVSVAHELGIELSVNYSRHAGLAVAGVGFAAPIDDNEFKLTMSNAPNVTIAYGNVLNIIAATQEEPQVDVLEEWWEPHFFDDSVEITTSDALVVAEMPLGREDGLQKQRAYVAAAAPQMLGALEVAITFTEKVGPILSDALIRVMQLAVKAARRY